MSGHGLTLAPFYDNWQEYNSVLVETVRGLSAEQLGWRVSPQHFTVWQLVAHIAVARAYWFCFLETCTEETAKLDEESWEDHEDHPRSADELAWALETTFKVIEAGLQRWTPEMLDDKFSRQREGRTQTLTRQFVIWRVQQHDAVHSGEMSAIFGMHGLPEIDFWAIPATMGGPPGLEGQPIGR